MSNHVKETSIVMRPGIRRAEPEPPVHPNEPLVSDADLAADADAETQAKQDAAEGEYEFQERASEMDCDDIYTLDDDGIETFEDGTDDIA